MCFYLLKGVKLKDLKPQQWVSLIHIKLRQIEHFTVTQAKSKFLG
jgi:hypothetical protein